MNKKNLIARIAEYLSAAVLIIAVIPAQTQAQQEEEINAERSRSIELERIVVTNRRTAIGLSEATEDVTVVTEDEIKQLPARNLSEALNYISGVNIEQRQGFGRATSITIQGSDSRQVRVMIDGIPLNTQASGQVNPSKFPIENVARIEVIKGSSSSMWGSGLGGVINVITKDTGAASVPKGSLTTSFAESRTRKDYGEISAKAGDMGYYLYSGYMESGGKGPKDDVLEKKVFSKISYDLKDAGNIESSFGFSQGDVNSGEYPDGTWEADPYRCQYGKAGWDRSFDSADIKLEFKNSRQDIIRKDYNTVADEVPWRIIRSRDVLYQVSAISTMRPRDRDLFIMGADFDRDVLKSTYLTEAKTLKLEAPYANYTLKSGQWDWNTGLRYDHNSEYGEDISPSFGCVYHLEDAGNTLIRANISHAFNAPPLLWKYYSGTAAGVTADNPDIKAERAYVYELGLETKPISKLQLKLSLYRADVSDAISNAQNAQGRWIKKNFKKFRRQGIGVETRLELLEGLSFSGAGSFNSIEDRAVSKVVKDAESPRQSFDLGMEYKNKKGFSLYINGRYDRWNKTFDTFLPSDRKFIFDLKTAQKIRHFTYFLNIYNLANSRYWSDYFFPVPKRYFEAGTTIDW